MTGERQKSIIDKIKAANAPPRPSDSVAVRFLILTALFTANFACAYVGEIDPTQSVIATVVSVAGIVFSYKTRNKPWSYIKVLIAISVLVVFFIFITQIMQNITSANLASIEPPLALLFLWIQALHSLDTPARRDLLFSVAASTALLVIAAAQSLSTFFFIYVAIWFISSALAMEFMYLGQESNFSPKYEWQPLPKSRYLKKSPSMLTFRRETPPADFLLYDLRPAFLPSSLSGSERKKIFGSIKNLTDWPSKLSYLLFSLLTATVIIIFLPPASTAQSLKLPSSIVNKIGLQNSGALYGGKTGTEPSKPGKSSAPIGIGGYNGFTNSLDTAIRVGLSDNIVMHVRATQPGYFLSMTYDLWDGTTWSDQRNVSKPMVIDGGSPFYIESGALSGRSVLAPSIAFQGSDIQTFYVEAPMANTVLGASQPATIWFPGSKLYVDQSDSSIRTGVAITPGTVYTVISSDSEQGPTTLTSDNYSVALLPKPIRIALQPYLELPRRYERVRKLTLAITDHTHGVYNKVAALESWMKSHVHYSLDIPPLTPGQDSVNQFLFHTRTGYCEQISTALAVMLRSIGIPTREAVGYVPGNFNPLTDLFDVRASDAHAWVQVWFPGYGWQNFDPTANVPLATPSPGVLIVKYIIKILKIIFWPAGFLLFLFGLLIFLILKIIDDRKTLPTKKFIASLDSLGSYLGLARSSSEPFALYYNKVMGHLDTRGKKQNNLLRTGQINAHICALINSTLYGNRQITDKDLLLIKKEIRNIKRMKKRLRIHSLFIKSRTTKGIS